MASEVIVFHSYFSSNEFWFNLKMPKHLSDSVEK